MVRQVPAVSVRLIVGGHEKFVMLREARQRALERTEKARAKRESKRVERVKADRSTASDVRTWFEDAARLHGVSSRLPSWRPQDRANAKRLLEEFGSEAVMVTVGFFFEHWERYVENSRGRLSGVPTPSLLLAMRSQVFVDCEKGRPPGIDTRKAERVRASEWSDDSAPDLDPDNWGLQ